MSFAPKRPAAFKISENLGYFYFKNTKFYLSLSTCWDFTKDQSERILHNFEDFSIKTFIQIHSFGDRLIIKIL